MSNIFSIYTFTNCITNKKYVGYTKNVNDRLKAHKASVKKGIKTKLYDAIRSYGWSNFSFDIIYVSKDRDYTQNIMENYFINYFDSFNNGYNMTLGGDGVIGAISWCKNKKCDNLKWSDERKINHSKYLKEIWDDLKKQNLSNKWTEEMKIQQKHKSEIAWKNKIDSGYKVKSNETFLTCPHCKKINNIGNSKRWHFDNCKYKMIGSI